MSSVEKLNKKILLVNNNFIIVSRGYTLYRRSQPEDCWIRLGCIDDKKNSPLSQLSLLRRLTRAEISRLYILREGIDLCIARKGIFRRTSGYNKFEKVFNVTRGSRPMNICENVDGCLYFGEYFANMEKKAVHIYSSHDHGKTWNIAYTFPEGNINHVHGIFFDPYTNKMWFATGDRENECIIGYTEDGFKSVTEVFRGGQDYRTCVLFFYKDFIVYGTDSQYQKNVLKSFNRQTLEITELQEVQGPVIKGTQFGDIAMISTDVEPSEVNKNKNAYLWITRDGLHWEELYHAEKDWLNPTFFQFGVFDLPQYSKDYKGTKVYATGKALKGCDGDTLVFDLNNL